MATSSGDRADNDNVRLVFHNKQDSNLGKYTLVTVVVGAAAAAITGAVIKYTDLIQTKIQDLDNYLLITAAILLGITSLASGIVVAYRRSQIFDAVQLGKEEYSSDSEDLDRVRSCASSAEVYGDV